MEFEKYSFLKDLLIKQENQGMVGGTNCQTKGEFIESTNPTNGKCIAKIREASLEDYEQAMLRAEQSKKEWQNWPMPKRGDVVRQFGVELRKYKKQLGQLISLEMGKILSEGEGEVQEAIDMCDYACGLSRTIGGKVIPSEREDHVIVERWNPLGIVGVITAFNFPHAVFGWNACIALVTGNCLIWKGSEMTSLVTLATAIIL